MLAKTRQKDGAFQTLRIGYNRAARLLEQMEKSGLVSAMATNGNRELIVPKREE